MLAGDFERDERQLLVLLAADQLELTGRGDLFRERARVVLHRLHDVAVAVVAEPREVVVLREHHRRAGREVQREGGIALAEVVLIEDEVLGEIRLLAEHEPADARVDEAELVA